MYLQDEPHIIELEYLQLLLELSMTHTDSLWDPSSAFACSHFVAG